MKREAQDTRLAVQLLLYIGLAILTAAPVLAQVPVDERGNPITPLEGGAAVDEADTSDLPLLSAGELEELVGPVALYPDDLLAIVLPASTYPLQVVQAARLLDRLESDPSLKPDEEWDDSITALLNYPEVVELMNEDIDWTWRLGEAVVAQQPDVIAAIEAFRDKAYAAGNLKSDEHQTVSKDDGVIEIEPVEEDVIYVPYYEPERVVVYQPYPVYHYYPRAYPLYYYPYPYGYSFASPYFWGVTTAFTIGWLTDHLHVYHHSYWGHPYYGHHYHNHFFYRRPSLSVFNRYYVYNSHRYWNYRYRDGDYWRPRRHGGARPGHDRHRVHYYRDRNRDDWRHGGNDRHDRQASDGRRRDDHAGRWAQNRDEVRNRVGFNGERDRNDRHGRSHGDREHRVDGGRQARFRDRDSRGSIETDTIRFRQRDARARADADRRRTRVSDDVNRDVHRESNLRTGFAANTRRSSTGSGSRRSNSRRGDGDALDRSKYAVQRHVPPSPPRQASTVRRPQQATRPGSQSFQRPVARAQTPRSAPQRSAPQRSSSAPSASPPSTRRASDSRSSRSESRSSKSGSRASGRRSEGRSKRRR